MVNYRDIKRIKIGLASSEEILSESYGEVLNPSTISYKNQQPEEGGLFCQKIFGPKRDYHCACGKYSQPKNRGKICEICEVEVTRAIVRRERFGHISLAAPVAHIWMLKAIPSKISTLLNLKTKSVEEIIYFVSYIVIDPKKSTLKKYQIIDQKKGRNIFRKEILNIKQLIESGEILTNISKEEKEFIMDSIHYYLSELKDTGYNYSFEEIVEFITNYTGAVIETGADSIQLLLQEIDVNKTILDIKKTISKKNSIDDRLVKRLAIFESFYHSGNKPDWMILNVIPVLPPDLRPIVMLSGDKHTASEINELYRRVLIRNERLKEIIKRSPAKIILNNEKRLLQEAVDGLIDNQRKIKPIVGKDKRPLKSLSDNLKGKTGRFRQNLLGKRVDYSGRSVIVVGPKLKMYECGLPRKMALELYKPFIISKIFESNDQDIYNPKMIENLINNQDDMIWPYLDQVIKERPVLLNRAPTLHRLGIQAFEVKLTHGKAIELHPLTTIAFNADFDGDQMAVHLPLSDLSVAEARSLMIGSRNIIGIKDGNPIAKLTQDMILGIYYLTSIKNNPRKLFIFTSIDDIHKAIAINRIKITDLILYQVKDIAKKGFTKEQLQCYLITTPGKVIFNDSLASNQRYYNFFDIKNLTAKDFITFNKEYAKHAHYVANEKEAINYLNNFVEQKAFNDSTLSQIFSEIYAKFKNDSGKYLDIVKDLGFKYSTQSGTTVSAFDIQFKTKINETDLILKAKRKIIDSTQKIVNDIDNYYREGLLSKDEAYLEKVKHWTEAKDQVQIDLKKHIENKSMQTNPMFRIAESGARGNISNFVQLSGMRGLMVSPKGKVIDIPIKSSFKEGLSMIEFFISTHGARKGMADTALKTADSGYLTRRLVDIVQDVIISSYDCGSSLGFKVRDIVDNKTNSVIISLLDRIYGRVLSEDLFDEKHKLIAKRNEVINKEIINKIKNTHLKSLKIRTVFNCNAKDSVCALCFGYDLSKHEIVSLGTPVGVISAQSIGEPGTQLTMRTFHTGGVAGGQDITQGLPRIKELLDVTRPKGMVAKISQVNGTVVKIEEYNNGNKTVYIRNDNLQKNKEIIEYKINYADVLRVNKNDKVKIGQKLTDGNIDLKELLSITDIYTVQKYILKEIRRVYVLQGIQISEKYIEIILRRMLNKIRISNPGDSEFLVGSYIDINTYKKVNQELFLKGKKMAYGIGIILGLKKAPLEGKSFLSSVSFQDTVRVLTNAAIRGRVDKLKGIKENVMLGKIIPCGTGLMDDNVIIEMGNKAFEEKY